MEGQLTVSCVQMDSIAGDIPRNLAIARQFLAAAKEKGAELAVLPELFNVGYNLDIIRELSYDQQETVSVLIELAKDLNLFIAAGILEVDSGQRFNSVIVLNNRGETVAKYRKMNLFPLSKEYEIFEPGREIVSFPMGNFRFGLMICFDIRFPELSRAFIRSDCTAIIVSSAFLFPRLDHWRTLLKARAIENQMYVLAANRVGRVGENWFLGNSCIIDPWGVAAAAMGENEEGVIVAELTMDKLISVKKMMPCKYPL